MGRASGTPVIVIFAHQVFYGYQLTVCVLDMLAILVIFLFDYLDFTFHTKFLHQLWVYSPTTLVLQFLVLNYQ